MRQQTRPRLGSAPLRGFVAACHPGPTVVVTGAVTALAVGAGRSGAGAALVLVTVLLGQLSVGWSNDAIDAPRDRAVSRTAKPVVSGLVTRRALASGALVALALSVALSFVAAGPAGGLCHVVFLASAWTYNLGVKSTRWSLVPYAVGFGALPGFVTYGLDPSRPPQPWATVAAALLGVAAGLANAAPDVDDDRATGVAGAVGRIGPRAARAGCVLALVLASAVLVVGAGLSPVVAVAAFAATVVAALVGLVGRQGRLLFPAVLLIALADVALLLTHAEALAHP